MMRYVYVVEKSVLAGLVLCLNTTAYAFDQKLFDKLDSVPKPKVVKPQHKVVKKHHHAKKVEVEPETYAEPTTPPIESAAPTPAAYIVQHEPEMVKLPNGLWMGKYEVTIEEYMECVDNGGCRNPEWLEVGSTYNINTGSTDWYKTRGMSLDNKRYPMTGVSWNDANDYAKWFSNKTGKTYRLPTEDEWLTACQAGQPKFDYCGSNNPDEVAWYEGNSDNKVHKVGQKSANAWHLNDMLGNVWEFTSSCYDSTCMRRVLRGGFWGSNPIELRSADHSYDTPDPRSSGIGFRLSSK